MSSLTSRQRVWKALNHEETDKVPVDFGGSRVSGIAAIAYKNLLEHLEIEEEIQLYDIKQQLANPSLEMIDRLGGDVVQLNRLGPTTAMPFLRLDKWKKGKMTDGTDCLVPEDYDIVFQDDGIIEVIHEGEVFARRTAFSPYFDICAVPLQNAETKSDLDAYVFPDPWTEREEEFLKSEIDRLYHGTDKALFAGLPLMNCSFLEANAVLFGYETFMMNLVLKRDLMEHWLDRMLEHNLKILDSFLKVVGPYITAIQMNDDFGAQEALQVPPNMYREMFKPRQKKWIDYVKARTDAKIFIHCDGAVEPILPDFIEIGIDILNPLQTSAKGMEPEKIKKEYGKDLCFWGGGVETQSTLPFGTVDEVAKEVQGRLELLSKGGGYVFGTIHNILPDISPENILAVFETARKFNER
jgi:uroporphyrinogen decarboxylase